jgi:ketosteroid isomerase-like protein
MRFHISKPHPGKERRMSVVHTNDQEAIRKVLASYYETFGRDVAATTACFGEPAMFVLPNEVLMLRTRSEVQAAIEKFVANLKAGGFSHSNQSGPRIKMLNSTTALYSVVAIRIGTDGSELSRAGFTYLLHKGDGGWKMHELIATDPDKLVSAD